MQSAQHALDRFGMIVLYKLHVKANGGFETKFFAGQGEKGAVLFLLAAAIDNEDGQPLSCYNMLEGDTLSNISVVEEESQTTLSNLKYVMQLLNSTHKGAHTAELFQRSSFNKKEKGSNAYMGCDVSHHIKITLTLTLP